MEERSKWQLVGWAVAAALLAIAAFRALGPDPGGGAPATAPPVRVENGGGAGSRGGEGAGLYVHVAGAVRRPGLYRVPTGARVAVALARAGGPLRRAELTAVNLAQPLEDGQQVVVPAALAGGVAAANAAGGAAVPGVAAAGAAGQVPISLATATQEQLEELDGIGPVLAGAIIQYRDENGGFRSIEQLQEVDGIGEKRFAALEEAVRP